MTPDIKVVTGFSEPIEKVGKSQQIFSIWPTK